MASPLDIWSTWATNNMARKLPAGPRRTSTTSVTEAALRALAGNPIPYRPATIPSAIPSLPFSPAPFDWQGLNATPPYQPEFYNQPSATPSINAWMYANEPGWGRDAVTPKRTTVPQSMIDAVTENPPARRTVPQSMADAMRVDDPFHSSMTAPQSMADTLRPVPQSMADAFAYPTWSDMPADRDFSEAEGSWSDTPASGTSYQPAQSAAALAASYAPTPGGSRMPPQWRDPVTGRTTLGYAPPVTSRTTLGYAPELPLNPDRTVISQDYINAMALRGDQAAGQNLINAIRGGASPERINQLALLTRTAFDPNGVQLPAPRRSGSGGGGNVRTVSLATHRNVIPNVPALVKGAPGSGWTSKNIEAGGIGAGALNKLVRDPRNTDVIPERAAALSNAYLDPSNWEWRERTGGGGDFVPVQNSIYKSAASRMAAAANPATRFSNVVVGPTPSGAYDAFANLQKFREQMRQSAIANDRAERVMASTLSEAAKNRELTAIDMALRRDMDASRTARSDRDTAFDRERKLNEETLKRQAFDYAVNADAEGVVRKAEERAEAETYAKMLGELYNEGAGLTAKRDEASSALTAAAQKIASASGGKFSVKHHPDGSPYFDGAVSPDAKKKMDAANADLRTSPEWQARQAQDAAIAAHNARLQSVFDAQESGVRPEVVGQWTNTNLFPRLPGSGASTNAPRSSTSAKR